MKLACLSVLVASSVASLNASSVASSNATTANYGCDATSLIAAHEGKKACVYTDTRGHPTVGIGFNLDVSGASSDLAACGADYDSVRSGAKCLTDSQITCLFKPTLENAESGARSAVSSYDSLCCNVQEVMTDMTFNLGSGGFASFTTFIGLINQKQWSAAAQDGKGTSWCSQVGSRCTDDMNRVASGC